MKDAILKLAIKLRHGAISLRDDQNGASMPEYAILLAIITVATIGAIQLLGTNVGAAFTALNNAWPTAAPAAP